MASVYMRVISPSSRKIIDGLPIVILSIIIKECRVGLIAPRIMVFIWVHLVAGVGLGPPAVL